MKGRGERKDFACEKKGRFCNAVSGLIQSRRWWKRYFHSGIFVSMSSSASPLGSSPIPIFTDDSVDLLPEAGPQQPSFAQSLFPKKDKPRAVHRRTSSEVSSDGFFLSTSSLDDRSVYSENSAPLFSHLDKFVPLHDQILSLVGEVSVTESEALARSQAFKTIQDLVARYNPAIVAETFGSFSTGLSLSSSDVDIVLMRVSSSCDQQLSTSSADVGCMPAADLESGSSLTLRCDCSNGDEHNSFSSISSALLNESLGASPEVSLRSNVNQWWEIPPPDPEDTEHNLKDSVSAAPRHLLGCTAASSHSPRASEAFSFDDFPAVLQACPRMSNISYINMAKIPIIKVAVSHDVPGLDPISVDITSAVSSSRDCSDPAFQHSGLRVRDFVMSALRDYPNIKPLVIVMKVVLSSRGLSSAYRGGLGSYPLFVIVYYWMRFRCQDDIKLGREEEQGALGRILMEFLKWFASMFPWETSALDWEPAADSEGSCCHFRPLVALRTDLNLTASTFKATVVVLDPLNPGVNVAAVSHPCFLVSFCLISVYRALLHFGG